MAGKPSSIEGEVVAEGSHHQVQKHTTPGSLSDKFMVDYQRLATQTLEGAHDQGHRHP